ncbi:uncharacterized protein LOC107792565 [Nicotiana tabacum]|uniref:Uncharacterized protein LOC107792565 n=1 Tax=Nicotiana tabacum TaxID=4097 RepID=A0A1S4A0V8_TOBAC|nr:PREDICTED: uncharacterized protein LOC107792565 [Nicotiana tabacum]
MSELPDFTYPMCKALKLTHLIFAYDLMIFCKGDLKSIARVMETLSHFSSTTGLVANVEKTNIYMAVIDAATQEQILARTGFTTGILLSSTLDFPSLSKNGSVLKEADKICRDYLWGSTEDHRKLPLLAWDIVCTPKKYGGLNIKGCRNWNIAVVGKLLWQLAIKKDVLWVKWVHGIYMKQERDIWNHNPRIDSSLYWRKLNSLKEVMTQWYNNGNYVLTENGEYSLTRSYIEWELCADNSELLKW